MRRLFARRSPGQAPSRFPKSDDERFTEADILTILQAGSAAASLNDLCAFEGIAVETYEAWKAKYGGLTLSQIKIRRRERSNRLTTLAVGGMVVVAIGAGYAFITRSAVPVRQLQWASVARNAAVQPRPPVLSGPAPAPPVSPQAAEPSSANLLRTGVSRPVEIAASGSDANARDLEAADPSGYSVQVAALPNREEAQAMMEQLAGVGYPAYLARTTVNETLLYRVRVGPLESRDAAQEVVRRLEIQGHRGSWVTR